MSSYPSEKFRVSLASFFIAAYYANVRASFARLISFDSSDKKKRVIWEELYT